MEELAVAGSAGMIPAQQILAQINQVKELMANCMVESVDYGKIPGCGDKPTLLQPGAQMINLMFGTAEDFEVQEKDLGNGHREYIVKCKLASKATGEFVGSGMGSCSTMESKYRYRNVADFEVLEDPIPDDARERKQEYRKQGFGMRKVDGAWVWVRYNDSQKSENPDIADTYNTVLKMACKRALVAATLNTFGVSSLFTQDIEDLTEYKFADKPSEATAQQLERYNDLAAEFSELCERDRDEVDEAVLNSAPVKQSGATSLEGITSEQASVMIRQLEVWVEKTREAKKQELPKEEIPF